MYAIYAYACPKPRHLRCRSCICPYTTTFAQGWKKSYFKSEYYRMETLELFAKISLNAHLLGGAKEIPKEQIDKLLYLRDNYYHVTGRHPGYKHYNKA